MRLVKNYVEKFIKRSSINFWPVFANTFLIGEEKHCGEPGIDKIGPLLTTHLNKI